MASERAWADDVEELIRETCELHLALERLVAEPERRAGGRGVRVLESKIPWNAQAAALVLELRELARRLEGQLLLDLLGEVPAARGPARGGSDENTRLALGALPGLVAGLGDDGSANLVMLRLGRWVGRARVVLGEAEPLEHLPRQPDGREPACPFCHAHTLRFQRASAMVRCVNPDCRDERGRRPRGRVELGQISGQPMLLWQSGDVGVDADPVNA